MATVTLEQKAAALIDDGLIMLWFFVVYLTMLSVS